MDQHAPGELVPPGLQRVGARCATPRRWRGRAAVVALLAVASVLTSGGAWAAEASTAPSVAPPPAGGVEIVLPALPTPPALLTQLLSLPADSRYPGRLLGRGLAGDDVQEVQAYLNTQGASLKVDGIYGPRTARAVRRFQRTSGVPVDGIVGPVTWARGPALAAAPQATPPTAPASPPTTQPPPTTAPPTTAALTTAAPATAAPMTAPPTTSAPTTPATTTPPTTAAAAATTAPVTVSSTVAPTTTAAATTTSAGGPPSSELALPASGDSSGGGPGLWIVIAATLALLGALIATAVLRRRNDIAFASRPRPVARSRTPPGSSGAGKTEAGEAGDGQAEIG